MPLREQTLKLATGTPGTYGARKLNTTTLNGTGIRKMTTTMIASPESKELRCHGCGKLLAEKAAPGTVIVCSRCKTRNEAIT